MPRSLSFVVAAFVTGTIVFAAPALTQEWPAKPVRIVSPFAAGGGTDVLARAIAEELSKQFKQQFVVENRGGDGGLIGAAVVARARPDGHTLLLSGMATHVVGPLISWRYNPLADFTNIAFIGGAPAVIVAHPSLDVGTLKDLIALLRRRPGPWRFVSPGVGTHGHLVGEYWAQKEKFRLSHAPYKSAKEYMNALVAGHVPIGSVAWLTARQHILSNALIPLAVSSARRIPEFDRAPTFRELGYPDLVSTSWYGLAAPKGLPPDITTRLNEAVGAAVDDGRISRLATYGVELDRKSPDELSAFIKEELTKWAPFLRKKAPSKKTAPSGRAI